ncbi:MAG: hypothetical protein MJB12_14855 [Firmicutes bacterium]|nr:hypothetical protein [Bacillota bacterium]
MSTSCNEKTCPCPHMDCERHGKCCACINHHVKTDSLVNCMRRIAGKA